MYNRPNSKSIAISYNTYYITPNSLTLLFWIYCMWTSVHDFEITSQRFKPIHEYSVGKTWFVYHTKYMQWKINESTLFAIDNMYYVNFKI